MNPYFPMGMQFFDFPRDELSVQTNTTANINLKAANRSMYMYQLGFRYPASRVSSDLSGKIEGDSARRVDFCM